MVKSKKIKSRQRADGVHANKNGEKKKNRWCAGK
jgi:hypothetical protein